MFVLKIKLKTMLTVCYFLFVICLTLPLSRIVLPPHFLTPSLSHFCDLSTGQSRLLLYLLYYYSTFPHLYQLYPSSPFSTLLSSHLTYPLPLFQSLSYATHKPHIVTSFRVQTSAATNSVQPPHPSPLLSSLQTSLHPIL